MRVRVAEDQALQHSCKGADVVEARDVEVKRQPQRLALSGPELLFAHTTLAIRVGGRVESLAPVCLHVWARSRAFRSAPARQQGKTPRKKSGGGFMADASEEALALESTPSAQCEDCDDGISWPMAPGSKKSKRMRPQVAEDATLSSPPNASLWRS